MVYDGVPLPCTLNLRISAGCPLRWMRYRPSAHHVQIHVCQTAYKMVVRFDGGRVVSILPEGALPLLSLVEFLSGPARD